MRAGFLVHQDLIGSGFDEHGRVTVWIRDHEVYIDGHARDFPERSKNRRTHREIRHEMAIHHIEMEHPATHSFELPDLVAQAREICREDGWKYLNHCAISY